MSLGDKLSNLHLLLRVPSFARWPLEVRFFADDVYQSWTRYSDTAGTKLRGGIRVSLDTQVAETGAALPTCSSETSQLRKSEGSRTGSIVAIDPSYASYKAHLDKSSLLLAEGEVASCVVCGQGIQTPALMALVCPNGECRAASHVVCLASKFLRDEGQGDLLPVDGNCPSCKSQLQWTRLVTEMTLRIRGKNEIERLKKKPRKLKTKNSEGKTALATGSIVDDTDDDSNGVVQFDEDEELSIADIIDEPLLGEAQDDSYSDMDDAISAASIKSDTPHSSPLEDLRRSNSPSSRLKTVIEDSDWDGAEILD